MEGSMNSDSSPIIVGRTTTPLAVTLGEQIEGLFRFGCSYAKLAKDGRHAIPSRINLLGCCIKGSEAIAVFDQVMPPAQ